MLLAYVPIGATSDGAIWGTIQPDESEMADIEMAGIRLEIRQAGELSAASPPLSGLLISRRRLAPD